jgi:hypothetical protein
MFRLQVEQQCSSKKQAMAALFTAIDNKSTKDVLTDNYESKKKRSFCVTRDVIYTKKAITGTPFTTYPLETQSHN